MLEALLEADRALFVTLNAWHVSWLDPVMTFFSAIWVWVPLYLGIIVALFRCSAGGMTLRSRTCFGLFALLAVVLCFVLCDQTGAWGKAFFGRLRPCWDPELAPAVHLLEGRGSRYGFPSNHAANCFGLAVLTARIFRHRLYSVLILLWAVLVAYSRIYVGKHFPLDVLCGALIGVVIALVIYCLFERWIHSRPYRRMARIEG